MYFGASKFADAGCSFKNNFPNVKWGKICQGKFLLWLWSDNKKDVWSITLCFLIIVNQRKQRHNFGGLLVETLCSTLFSYYVYTSRVITEVHDSCNLSIYSFAGCPCSIRFLSLFHYCRIQQELLMPVALIAVIIVDWSLIVLDPLWGRMNDFVIHSLLA